MRLYLKLAMKDVFRLWSATQLQVVIIAGICLPILMLLGLSNGMVTNLRNELMTNPFARRLSVHAGNKGRLLTAQVREDLQSNQENIDLIVPITRIGGHIVSSVDSQDNPSSITLKATVAGDPLHTQYGADIGDDPNAIILTESMARAGKLNIGDTLIVRVHRKKPMQEESETWELKLVGLNRDESQKGNTGWVQLGLIDHLKIYRSGNALPARDISASENLRALDLYEKLLLVCERNINTGGGGLREEDHAFLARQNLVATPSSDPQIVTLFGTLKENASEDLIFYEITKKDFDPDTFSAIKSSPEFITKNNEMVGDFVISWSDPLEISLSGDLYRLVGLSLPTGRDSGSWIKEYIQPGARWFNYEETTTTPLSAQLTSKQAEDLNNQLSVQLNEDVTIQLTPMQQSSENLPNDAPAQNSTTTARDSNALASKDTDPQNRIPDGLPDALASKDTDPQNRIPDGLPDALASKDTDPQNRIPDGLPDALASKDTDPQNRIPDGLPDALASKDTDPQNRIPDGLFEALEQAELSQLPNKAIEKPSLPSSNPDPTPTDNTLSADLAPATLPASKMIVVPSSLLAYIAQLKSGTIDFDPIGNKFVDIKKPITYADAYFYARTIDHVKEVKEHLDIHNYTAIGQLAEIEKIQDQGAMLYLLVKIVAGGVFGFGVITVFTVLVDSTDRKKGTIGIFRVMGVSGLGVFYIVLLRAFIIGLLAALLCSLLGFFTTLLLNDQSSQILNFLKTLNIDIDKIDIVLSNREYAIIAAGAVLCACIGALLPAYKASRLDPFEAITEARTQ